VQSGTPFDVVVLDLTIRGGWGGMRTVEEIRRIDSEVPIIVASGYADDPAMARPRDFGFTDSIRKPFSMKELSLLVARITPSQPQ
jgi:DNA-binding NtrC family response regulator